jgi:hypothetical protein
MRDDEEWKLGKIAYDAYCGTTGFKSAITGDPLPPFHLTPEAVQSGWIAAAGAVRWELKHGPGKY